MYWFWLINRSMHLSFASTMDLILSRYCSWRCSISYRSLLNTVEACFSKMMHLEGMSILAAIAPEMISLEDSLMISGCFTSKICSRFAMLNESY